MACKKCNRLGPSLETGSLECILCKTCSVCCSKVIECASAKSIWKGISSKIVIPIGCGDSCSLSHSGDGDCLKCGKGWGNHGGHNCSGGAGRGSWLLPDQKPVAVAGAVAGVKGCDPFCSNSHSGHGDCLTCGSGWGSHSGHTCSGGRRGFWKVLGATPPVLAGMVGCNKICKKAHTQDGLCLICRTDSSTHNSHRCADGKIACWIENGACKFNSDDNTVILF